MLPLIHAYTGGCVAIDVSRRMTSESALPRLRGPSAAVAKVTACYLDGFYDFYRGFATHHAGTLSPAQLQTLMKPTSFTTTRG